MLFKLTRDPAAKKRGRYDDARRRCSGASTVCYVQGDFHAEPEIDRSWYFPFHAMLLRV
jgi:hypothetical protein